MYYAEDRVLVAVMNNQRDFEIARDEGWYRIPVCHVPLATTEAVVLAFYFTKVFEGEKRGVHWYAPVLGHELVRRRDLLPAEPSHPRAEEPYYKLQIGPLEKLERSIPSRRWRRITFIATSWDRFMAAEEINDLYVSGADGLFVTLKEAGFWPEREIDVREGDTSYTADLAIPCQDGMVVICLDERPAPANVLRQPDLETVCKEVARLGGEMVRQNKAPQYSDRD